MALKLLSLLLLISFEIQAQNTSSNLAICVEVTDPFIAVNDPLTAFTQKNVFSKNCRESNINCPGVVIAEPSFVCGGDTASLQIILTTKNISDGVYVDNFYYRTAEGLLKTLSNIRVTNNIAIVDIEAASNLGFNATMFGYKDKLATCLFDYNESEPIDIPSWDYSPIQSLLNVNTDIVFCGSDYGQPILTRIEDLTARVFGDELLKNYTVQWYSSKNLSGNQLIFIPEEELISGENYYFFELIDNITGCTSRLLTPISVRISKPEIQSTGSISFLTEYCSLDKITVYDLEPSFFDTSSAILNDTFGKTKWFASETGSEEVSGSTVIKNNQTLWLGADKTFTIGQIENHCYSKRELYTFTIIEPVPEAVVEILESEFPGFYEIRISSQNTNAVYELENYNGISNNGVYTNITEGTYRIINKSIFSESPYNYSHINTCTTYTDVVVKNTIDNPLNTSNFTTSNSIYVYPNPAQDILDVYTPTNTPIESIEIYNPFGQLVLHSNTKKINVSNLKQGLHIIIINTVNGTTVKKFTKE